MHLRCYWFPYYHYSYILSCIGFYFIFFFLFFGFHHWILGVIEFLPCISKGSCTVPVWDYVTMFGALFGIWLFLAGGYNRRHD